MAFIIVDGVSNLPTPSSFQVTLQSISAPDSGRTLDGLMHDTYVATKRTIQIGWNFPTPQEMAAILAAFPYSDGNGNRKYMNITYWDPENAVAQVTKTFYVGDKPTAMQTWAEGKRLYANIQFNLIER